MAPAKLLLVLLVPCITAFAPLLDVGQKCYALAFGLGDYEAAYQAGALKAIVSSGELSADEYAYDSVSGVSGGALNAVILANYTQGQEQQAVVRMEEFWNGTRGTSLFKAWFGGIKQGHFFEGGTYNSSPLEDFLKDEFKGVQKKNGRDVSVANATSGAHLVDALYASMSPARSFPAAEGIALAGMELEAAIGKCAAKGFSDDQIVVDALMTSAEDVTSVSAKYSRVTFRYSIAPSTEVQDTPIEKAFALGVEDAEHAIAAFHQSN
mmetsp:Transcript_14662/g.43280  ORF Transcript_14662/g.43280 Transcript_14662/m.43280 type:complete len:266 (-) Transcript_14662:173-970(-)